MEKLRYSIPEFVEITGTPRTTVFQRIRRGELDVVRDGRKVFITREETERYVKTSQPHVAARQV